MSSNTSIRSATVVDDSPPAVNTNNNDLPVHDDLFPSNSAMDSNLNYIEHSNTTTSSSSRQRSILTSIYTQENNTNTITSSWKMKSLVLLCMLSLPGKVNFYIEIYLLVLIKYL